MTATKSVLSHLRIAKNIVLSNVGLYGKEKTILLLFFILVLWHHCDYLIQGRWWGWDTWWILNSAGIKYNMYIDWIFPKDSWHFVQWTRTVLTAIAAIVTAYAYSLTIITKVNKWYHYVLMVLFWMFVYWCARGIGFSLPKIINL